MRLQRGALRLGNLAIGESEIETVLGLLDDPAREGSGVTLACLALFAHSLLGSYVHSETINP